METITTTVYNFDELSDEAKEKARDWYREGALDYEWWDCTYNDAATIGLKITSFDLDHGTISGELLWSVDESIDTIMANHGKACGTYKTALLYNRAEDLEDYKHDLLEDYRIMLNHEMEYLLSDEAVDESIEANEYTFTESGKRFK